MAVHGWWLGNPLVYKPGAADLVAVARELADAGAASGTLILGEEGVAAGSAPITLGPAAWHHDRIEAVLILRPPLALPLAGIHQASLQSVALHAVLRTAQGALGPNAACTCDIRWPRQIVLALGGDQPGAPFCTVEVEEQSDAAFVRLRLALDRLRAAGVTEQREDGGEGQASGATLFARPDWREVFLARMLHALEGRLRESR